MLPDPMPYFAELQDPRRETKNKLHKLTDIVLIVLCAVLSGVEDWVGMEDFAEEKEEWFRTFLELPNGVPSHDTLSNVFGRLNPKAFAECPKRLGLYGVMPDSDWVKRMVDAELPTVQLRFKSEDKSKIKKQIAQAVSAVEGSKTLLFINDYWQEAIAAGAYGVHLGQEDMETANLEAIRNAGLRLGLSTHGYAEMVYADRFCPSYIAMGAVFPTPIKQMPTAPQGLGRIYQYAKLMSHYPLVAIGGIDETSIHAVAQSGVGSVALIRAITNAKDPKAAVKHLQELMRT